MITPSNDSSSSVRFYTEVIEAGGMEFVVSNLEICGISLDDSGIYSCSAVLGSGTSATSDDFWVNVTSAGRKLEKFTPITHKTSYMYIHQEDCDFCNV